MTCSVSKFLSACALSVSLMFSATGVASAVERDVSQSSVSSSTIRVDPGFTSSVEELFAKYMQPDRHNYFTVKEEAVRKSPYASRVEDLRAFAMMMNELYAHRQGMDSRDAWSFAKCVVADAIGVNMVGRLTTGLLTAIRAAQWPLAARTILQIGASAGLSLGWKANAIGLALALGKSAFFCRDKW